MHNRLPQLGYYHSGLGRYVYHDSPQMGDIFSDIGNALQQGINTITGKAGDDLKNLAQQGQNAVMSNLLDTPTGQQVQQQGITAAVQARTSQLTTQFTAIVKKYQTYLIIGGGALVLYMIMRKPSRRETVTQYIPFMGSAPAAKTNPRRKRRRKSKVSRKRRK